MIIQGDCLEKMAELEDNSVDSIVTDPPYGLSFMGKSWDYDVPKVEIWKECLRVLKPGGYLLSFAGTRTQHRMAVNIEDAGFEIRDMIAWVYGSGFPKSHNIGKAVDKLQGNEREELGRNPNSRENCDKSNTLYESGTVGKTDILTKGNSEWEGWGTALKPALEPITVARKPFKGTVAENVLKYGTGGINIDECRIEHNGESMSRPNNEIKETDLYNKETSGYKKRGNPNNISDQLGRFPANLIHDGSEEVVEKFPNESARFFYCPKASKKDRNEGLDEFDINRPDERTKTGMGTFEEKGVQPQQNFHPTVKPTELMQYLVRLVTRKGGTVLDPFMGSGSTGKACVKEGMEFIGIDLDPEYCKIAEARIKSVKQQTLI